MPSLASRCFFLSCLGALGAAALVGCGGQVSADHSTGGEPDGGAASTSTTTSAKAASCTRVNGVTTLDSSPLPNNDGFTEPQSDGTYAYVGGLHTLYRVPIAGGAPEVVTTTYFVGLQTFVARAGTVAWVAQPASALPDASAEVGTGIMVENASGVHAVALPAGATVTEDELAVDAEGDVFFELEMPDSTSVVEWWNPATGAAAPVPGVDSAFVNIYFADKGQIVWAGDGVFLTDAATGTTRKLDTPGETFGSIIGMDATYVYGLGSVCPDGPCPFTVTRAPRDGSASSVAFASDDAYWLNGTSVDATGLYFVDWTTGSVYHAPLDGGGSATVVTGITGDSIPNAIGLDDCNVYWTTANSTGGNQKVIAAPK